MRVNGKMIYSMVMELKRGMMGLNMKAVMLMAKNKGVAYIIGQMGTFFF